MMNKLSSRITLFILPLLILTGVITYTLLFSYTYKVRGDRVYFPPPEVVDVQDLQRNGFQMFVDDDVKGWRKTGQFTLFFDHRTFIDSMTIELSAPLYPFADIYVLRMQNDVAQRFEAFLKTYPRTETGETYSYFYDKENSVDRFWSDSLQSEYTYASRYPVERNIRMKIQRLPFLMLNLIR